MKLSIKLRSYMPSPGSIVDLHKSELQTLIDQAGVLEVQKDGAYSERNQLVAALSKLFPASLERHPDTDAEWEDDWRWIVFIDLPPGQVSWHIHDSELPLFDHLPRNQQREWDGHTTEQKYQRLKALACNGCQEPYPGACPEHS